MVVVFILKKYNFKSSTKMPPEDDEGELHGCGAGDQGCGERNDR